jgi:hypothetical protein
MAEIVVRRAVEVDDVAVVRRLMRGYGDYLASNPAGAANICLEGYEQELDGLPGEYAVLLLAWVDEGVVDGGDAVWGPALAEAVAEGEVEEIEFLCGGGGCAEVVAKVLCGAAPEVFE